MAEALGSKQKKRRFKEPQTLEETKMVVGQSIPKTTQYKTRWGVRIFENWRRQRNNKLPECEVNPLGLNVSFGSNTGYAFNFNDESQLKFLAYQIYPRVNREMELHTWKRRCIK